MCEMLDNLIAETEVQLTVSQNQEDLYSIYISLDKPIFSHILIHFDGFSSLFNSIFTMKSAVIN